MAASDATALYTGSGHGYISAQDAKDAITQWYSDMAAHRITTAAAGVSHMVTAMHSSAISLRSTAGQGNIFPVHIPTDMTISAVSIYVNSASTAGQTQRIAFYNMHSNGWKPSTLIVDCGTVATDTTGAKTVSGLSASLPKGVIWGAVIAQNGVATGGQCYAGVTGHPMSAGVSLTCAAGSFVYSSIGGAAPADLSSGSSVTFPGLAPTLLISRSA